jgi:hypothetical protein
MFVSVARIVFALSLATLVIGIAGAGAVAQTPGPALLAGLNPPHQPAQPLVHSMTTHMTAHKPARKVARKFALRRRHSVAVAASTPLPQRDPVSNSATPAGEQPVLDNAGSAQTSPVAAPAPAPAPNDESAPPAQNADAQDPDTVQSDGAHPDSVRMNGQTVEIASPDYLNDIDRAANDRDIAASTAAPDDSADATPAAVVAVAKRTDASQVGSASWIAQVLAALGGAIAAASVAWFLIGSGPVRNYS